MQFIAESLVRVSNVFLALARLTFAVVVFILCVWLLLILMFFTLAIVVP